MTEFDPLRPIIFLGALRTGIDNQIVSFTVRHAGGTLEIMADDAVYPSPMPEDSDEILNTVYSTVILILDDLNRQRGDLFMCQTPPAIVGFFCQTSWADVQTQAAALYARRKSAVQPATVAVETRH
jgi:hypothetical protein